MPKAKLTYGIAEEIRALHQTGASVYGLAKRYNVDPGTIYPLLRYATWKSPHGQARRPQTEVASRLWAKIFRCPHEACLYCCWEWRGAFAGSHSHPYGVIYDHGKQRKAHKVAWEIWNQQVFPQEKLGLHYCHNTRCVNPLHIYPGTSLQNVQDMDKAGRRVNTKGIPRPYAKECIKRASHKTRTEGNHNSHLTMDDILAIREIHRRGLRKHRIRRKDLAKQYGLSLGGLDHILYGNTQYYKPSLECIPGSPGVAETPLCPNHLA